MKKCILGHRKLVYKHSFQNNTPMIECEECNGMWEKDGSPWTGSMGMSYHRGEKELSDKTVKSLIAEYNYQRYVDNKDSAALIDIARKATPESAMLRDEKFARAVRAMVKLPESKDIYNFVFDCLPVTNSYYCPEFSALVFIYACEEFLDHLETVLAKKNPSIHLPVYFYLAFPKTGLPKANEIVLNHLENLARAGNTDVYGGEYGFAANAALGFHENYDRLGEIALKTAEALKRQKSWYRDGRNCASQIPVYNLIDAVDKALGGSKYSELLCNIE